MDEQKDFQKFKSSSAALYAAQCDLSHVMPIFYVIQISHSSSNSSPHRHFFLKKNRVVG